MDSNTTKMKSFWERPEGNTGTIVLGFFVTAIVILLYKALPFIITLLQNAIYAAFLIGILGVIIFLATNDRIRKVVSYLFQSSMRKITYLIIKYDPIGNLRNAYKEVGEKNKKIDEEVSNFRGEVEGLANEIVSNNKNIESSIKKAEISKKQNNQNVLIVETKQIGRLREINERHIKTLGKMKLLYLNLRRWQDACLVLYADMGNEIRERDRDYKMSTSAFKAINNVTKIMNGEGTDKEIYDQTIEYLTDDYNNKMGAISHFFDKTKNMIEEMDIEQELLSEKGNEILSLWENNSSGLQLPDKEQYLLELNKLDQIKVS